MGSLKIFKDKDNLHIQGGQLINPTWIYLLNRTTCDPQ